MMTANYHTHTPRCHHAVGDEREYIENAIKAGIKLLGFSDHTPQLYENGYISQIRMTPEEAPGYVDRLRTLADEYRGDIEIHIGFEAEYFPGIFDRLQGLCRDLGVEYLILGQHCLSDESEGAVWSTSPAGEGELKKYVDVVTEGLSTGCFTYLAHPDVLRYTGGDEKFYHDEMTRLCRAAKELSVPLEINMLGLGDHRFIRRTGSSTLPLRSGSTLSSAVTRTTRRRFLTRKRTAGLSVWQRHAGLIFLKGRS